MNVISLFVQLFVERIFCAEKEIMCSTSTQLKCSICNGSTTTNRIIVETCGHQKCRECFIREEDGCSICTAANASHATEENRNQMPMSSQPDDFSGGIEQDKRVSVIENVLISTNSTPSTTAPAKMKRPAHITVRQDDSGKVIEYTCTLCKKSFKSRNNQQYHLYCDKSIPKPFECARCGKQFITQSHLHYHEQAHENQVFRCNICDRVFSAQIGLRKHARKHTNEFKYECKLCDHRFRYKDQLNVHENRHNNIFHNCTECPMQFLIKSNLTKHMLAHTRKNQEMCSICRKWYSGKSALKVHMLTHSNQRRFKCNSCVKTFIDQRTLDRHLRTHASNQYYKCTLCRAKSTRKDNIRRHVRNLHAESGVDVQTILDGIFRKYSDRNKPTDVDGAKVMREEKTKSSPAKSETSTAAKTVNEQFHRDDGQQVKNMPMSVIKFVGKASAPIDVVKEDARSSTVIQTHNDLSKSNQYDQHNQSYMEPVVANDWNTLECGVVMPTYQPLTLDPIPQMEPLPLLTTRNNTNLSVYRQLLSPYLRRAN